MPSYIIRLEREGSPVYLEWSTIVDAPTTNGMTLEDLHEHVRDRYGSEGLRELPARLERVAATGCSRLSGDLDELLECNRAGPNEEHLTREQIVERYCRAPPSRRADERR
jgi:hypothetical protein